MKLATCPALLASAVKLLRFLKATPCHKTVSEMLYQKYTAPLTRWSSHHHILNWLLGSIPKCPVSLDCTLLKDSVVCLNYSWLLLWEDTLVISPSHWTTYFGWFLLRCLETKCCCTGFCSLPYNGDCQDSIRYWKDSLDFGLSVSERHGFTALYSTVLSVLPQLSAQY